MATRKRTTMVGDIAAHIQGQVLLPETAGYDRARRVFNAMIDRRPAAIVRCAGADDVAAGVRFARDHDLPLAVKGGGHGVAGNAVCDGGLVLDMSSMKHIRMDPARRTAVAQAGVTLGDLDDATRAAGLATPTGVVSVTGLSGLALGGGLGWLNGLYGLTCDNVLATEVVTASGDRIIADSQEHPDLFWALRGGGGNFGVVTSFRLELHPVTTVLAGRLTYAPGAARTALAAYHEVAMTAPDELTTMGSVFRADGEVGFAVIVCHVGSPAAGERLLRPLRAVGPMADDVQEMPYHVLQRSLDGGFPTGMQHYWKAGSLAELDARSIDVMLEFAGRIPSENSGVGLQQLHGAASRIDPTATAYPHRQARYDWLILSQWADPADSPPNIAWTRELFDAMRPSFADGVYVNNLGDEGDGRVRQAYGHNHERLVAVKTRYDPENVFRHNQNIAPAGTNGRGGLTD
jgi:FAD/FMN-containing dehydrogenase